MRCGQWPGGRSHSFICKAVLSSRIRASTSSRAGPGTMLSACCSSLAVQAATWASNECGTFRGLLRCVAMLTVPADAPRWHRGTRAGLALYHLRRSEPLPQTSACACWATKRPPEGGLCVPSCRLDQAVSVTALRRRKVMKPTPKKPRIIMAHVEGSGTAATPPVMDVILPSNEVTPPSKENGSG